jgi:hypothetical protein
MHLSAYGMYGYALMCSVTIRDFFNLGVKYHKLATPTLSIQWREEAQAAVWYFPDAFISAPSIFPRRVRNSKVGGMNLLETTPFQGLPHGRSL